MRRFVLNCDPSTGVRQDWTFADAVEAGVVPDAAARAEVDLRGGDWPVRDQGTTGACVGFAAADGVLHWHYRQAGLPADGERPCLVGYTGTHFIVRNSWGQRWGDGGFAYASDTDIILHVRSSRDGSAALISRLIPEAPAPAGPLSVVRTPTMLHDENYKRLFASKLMVEHLLRACLPADLLAAADFTDLGKLSTAYVSDELRKRHGDTVWRLRLGEHWVYLLILLEFQSEDDPWMALRIHTYSGLLYQELVRNEAPGIDDGRLPSLLPVVLYNGTEPWTAARRMSGLVAPGAPWLAPYQPAQGYLLLDLQRVGADDVPSRNLLHAVAALEQSRSFGDVLRVRDALQLWLRDPRAAELRRAFVDWIRQIAERVAPAGAVVPPVRTLEDVRMTLVERAAEWPKQWLREGREQGLAEGREQGIEQGVDQQRALLCRQAAARFGADTAARLTDVLAPITDPDRLAEIGDWLVRCDTAAEFLARLDPS